MNKEPVDLTDEKQIKERTLSGKFAREQELNDLRDILSTAGGRRFIGRILAECRVHQTVWSPGAEIHKRAGAQEIGHWVLAESTQADRELAMRVMFEAYEREIKGDKNVHS